MPVTRQAAPRRRLRRRRLEGLSAALLLLALAPIGLALSAGAGAAIALERASHVGAVRLAAGDYPAAAGVFHELRGRTGALSLLDRDVVRRAGVQEDHAVLEWARSLARRGQPEVALALLDTQLGRRNVPERARVRGELLLDGSRAAMQHGDPVTAVARLKRLQAEAPLSDLAAQADRLLPTYRVAEAQRLVRDERPVEAVEALDAAVASSSASGATAARAALPDALLAAARLAEKRDDHGSAAALLGRLVRDHADAAAASTARALLQAAEPVVGTLVRRDGSPAQFRVRLGTRFVETSDGGYAGGPYYVTGPTESGDFRFDSVPVGGPYILQVQQSGQWVTPVDRESGHPAYTPTVTPLVPVDLTFLRLPL